MIKKLRQKIYEKKFYRGEVKTFLNGKIYKENFMFPSSYGIGQRVMLNFYGAGTLNHAYVRRAMFTNGKVYYSIKLYMDVNDEEGTTIHNVDSYHVEEYLNIDGVPEFLEFELLDVNS